MISGLGSFLDRLDSLFGKNYLVAGFVPVLVFATLSAFLLYVLDPDLATRLLAEINSGATLDQTASWVGIGIVLALAGYLHWSLNASYREILEGRYLPGRIRREMEAKQQAISQQLSDRINELRKDLAYYRKHMALDNTEAVQSPQDDEVKQRQWANLLNPKTVANKSVQDPNDEPRVESTLAAIEQHLTRFRELQSRRELIPFEDANRLFKMLEGFLPRKEEPHLSDEELRQWQLARIEFLRIARYGLGRVEASYDRYWSRKFFRFPNESASLGPTAMANMSEIHRNYGKVRYGMEIDLMWPRMQPLVAGDTAFSALLHDSKLKLDFAVSMTAASSLFMVTSMVIVGLYSNSYWPFVVFPALTMAATAMFYLLALRAYRAFGEVLRSAIDLFRFDLLDELHLPRPINSEVEKEAWSRLSDRMLLRSNEQVDYRHGEER